MRIRADLRAHCCHACNVLLDVPMHLDLEVPYPLIRERAGILRHVRRRLDRQDAQARELPHSRSAEEIAYRHAEATRPNVMQRAIDAGLSLVVPEHQPVEIIENAR